MDRAAREEAVDWFAMRMKLKLREPRNEGKGSWREEPFYRLLARLNDERRELESEVDKGAHYNVDALIDEAVDVAAFAMMIADRARQLKG